MIKGASFGFNPETAQDNAYMNESAEISGDTTELAHAEFAGVVQKLNSLGV
jgi:hypothetical protein